MCVAWGFGAVLVAVAYPAAVYLGLTYMDTRAAGLLLFSMLAISLLWRRGRQPRRQLQGLFAAPLVILAAVALGAALDDARYYLAIPVLVNLALLAAFGLSLRGPESMVERFARLQDPGLSPDKVRYCRQVTRLWCLFFVLNGSACALLATVAPLSWWTLYTGLLSYVLMGTVFGGEYLVRRARFGPLGGSDDAAG